HAGERGLGQQERLDGERAVEEALDDLVAFRHEAGAALEVLPPAQRAVRLEVVGRYVADRFAPERGPAAVILRATGPPRPGAPRSRPGGRGGGPAAADEGRRVRLPGLAPDPGARREGGARVHGVGPRRGLPPAVRRPRAAARPAPRPLRRPRPRRGR